MGRNASNVCCVENWPNRCTMPNDIWFYYIPDQLMMFANLATKFSSINIISTNIFARVNACEIKVDDHKAVKLYFLQEQQQRVLVQSPSPPPSASFVKLWMVKAKRCTSVPYAICAPSTGIVFKGTWWSNIPNPPVTNVISATLLFPISFTWPITLLPRAACAMSCSILRLSWPLSSRCR